MTNKLIEMYGNNSILSVKKMLEITDRMTTYEYEPVIFFDCVNVMKVDDGYILNLENAPEYYIFEFDLKYKAKVTNCYYFINHLTNTLSTAPISDRKDPDKHDENIMLGGRYVEKDQYFIYI